MHAITTMANKNNNLRFFNERGYGKKRIISVQPGLSAHDKRANRGGISMGFLGLVKCMRGIHRNHNPECLTPHHVTVRQQGISIFHPLPQAGNANQQINSPDFLHEPVEPKPPFYGTCPNSRAADKLAALPFLHLAGPGDRLFPSSLYTTGCEVFCI